MSIRSEVKEMSCQLKVKSKMSCQYQSGGMSLRIQGEKK